MVIDTGGKQAAQCQAAIGRANRVLSCIRMGIINESKKLVLTLHRNLVRATSGILCAPRDANHVMSQTKVRAQLSLFRIHP